MIVTFFSAYVHHFCILSLRNFLREIDKKIIYNGRKKTHADRVEIIYRLCFFVKFWGVDTDLVYQKISEKIVQK